MEKGKAMSAISVIVPVYNVEKYIGKCLESILNQSFQDFEVILVDDGSIDKSLSILNEYKEKHADKVKIISQSNQGVSVARNRGILESTSTYIMFVDSDDWLEDSILHTMYQSAKENQSDLVLCDARVLHEDMTFKEIWTSGDLKSQRDSIFQNKRLLNSILPAPWGKLYKRSLFVDHHIEFPQGLRNQDLGTTPRILCHAKSISKVSSPLYNYVHRKGSAVRTYDYKILDIVKNLKIVKEYYEKEELMQEFKEPLEYLFIEHLLFRTVRRLSNVEDSTMKNEMIDTIVNYLNQEFPMWHKNSYIKDLPLKKKMYLQVVHKGFLKKIMLLFGVV